MAQKNDGKNTTVWCGEVIEGLQFSHEIKNKETGEIVEKFYRFSMELEVKTNKGKVLDESVLPMVVSDKYLQTLEKPIEVGDIVFVRGSWRAYTVLNESEKRKVEQVGVVSHISHTTLKNGKSLNRFDFEGYLVNKLYVPLKDAEGNPQRDPVSKQFVPLLDEHGNKQYTVRLNREKKVVNDYTIAINKNNRSYYIPCLSYFNLAKKIANEIDNYSKVKGSGYIRSRFVPEKNQTVYEAVVVSLEQVSGEEGYEVS